MNMRRVHRAMVLMMMLLVGALAWGASEDFAVDPLWGGTNNRDAPHDFGFSNTDHCGRVPGELGGMFSSQPAYYATSVGPFDHLHGRLFFGFYYKKAGGSEGSFSIGLFEPRENGERPDALAIRFENGDQPRVLFAIGEDRTDVPVTHMDAVGDRFPTLVGDGAVHYIELDYDPDEGPHGRIRVLVDRVNRFLYHLTAEQRAASINLTHFGLFAEATQQDEPLGENGDSPGSVQNRAENGVSPGSGTRLGQSPFSCYLDDVVFTSTPGETPQSNAVTEVMRHNHFERPTVGSARILRPGHHRLDDPMLVALHQSARLAHDASGERIGWEAPENAVGKLKTPYLLFPTGKGSRLTLDADIKGGEILVQFLDARGNAIPGFSFVDCVPLTSGGDDRVVLRWEAVGEPHLMRQQPMDLARLNQTSVAIEFRIRNARFYAFAIEPGEEIPMYLGDGPHLFVDDYLIRSTERVTRRIEQPLRLLYMGDRPGEWIPFQDPGQNPAVAEGIAALHTMGDTLAQQEPQYPTWGEVLFDHERKVFRWWLADPAPGVRQALHYAESTDILDWPQPDEKRIVFKYDGFGGTTFDDGPNAPNADRRYKAVYYVHEPPPLGTHVAFSPDGIEWTPYAGNPVIPTYSYNDPAWAVSVGDVTSSFWDPIRRHYGMFVRNHTKSAEEFGVQSFTGRPGLGVRLDNQTVSDDFIHWELPWRVMCPDALDTGLTEFHGVSMLARGDLLLAFVNKISGALSDNCPTELAVSHDGRHWQRFREPFLAPNPDPAAVDHGMAWAGHMPPWQAGDRVFFHYGTNEVGFKSPKGYGRWRRAWAVIPRDRYVARVAEGDKAGVLCTHLLKYTVRDPLELAINTDADAGELRVQITDVDSRPLQGFAFDDCRPISEDSLDTPVTWRRPLDELRDQPFHLEFQLRNAKLYGFSFKKAPGGAKAPQE
ncbi:MAG TPA: hypothetical protein HPP83_03340 [Candidatus Hydrogenedentes bacterium]|nr:hypothetical protein [Candidatus Hydrogenedentota bacterium]